MKPAVLNILSFIFLSVSAVSCRKNDSGAITPPKSKTILLTQAAWKVQTVSLDANKDGVADSDVTGFFQSCKLDNTYTFKTDGTGAMDEGAAKCTGTDPQTQAFTWVFKTGETILAGTFTFINGDATIISMNDTSLVVAYDDTATSSHVIATLKH